MKLYVDTSAKQVTVTKEPGLKFAEPSVELTMPATCGVGVPLSASMVNSWTLEAAKAALDISKTAPNRDFMP